MAQKSEGRKDDNGKLQWSLVPWDAMAEVVKVLMYGANKYGAQNWKQVPNGLSRYGDALLRHVIAYTQGNEKDLESGLPELAHIATNALFLLWVLGKL